MRTGSIMLRSCRCRLLILLMQLTLLDSKYSYILLYIPDLSSCTNQGIDVVVVTTGLLRDGWPVTCANHLSTGCARRALDQVPIRLCAYHESYRYLFHQQSKSPTNILVPVHGTQNMDKVAIGMYTYKYTFRII